MLRRQVEGISSRVLTERLRTLEGARFIFRHYEPTIPPAVTYGITERMKDIEKVLHQLQGLSRKWQREGAIVPARDTLRPGCLHSLRTSKPEAPRHCPGAAEGRLPRSSWGR